MLQDSLSHYQAALRSIHTQDMFLFSLIIDCTWSSTLNDYKKNLSPHNSLTESCYSLFNECNLMVNTFCRINPQNEAAKKGLERLEKQMKVRLVLVQLIVSFFCSHANHGYAETKLVTSCREWIRMHLKKRKKTTLKMQTETKKRLSFCKVVSKVFDRY